MKVIIIGSKAYKRLVARIDKIERYITATEQLTIPGDDDWVDGEVVCKYLGISERTLQRLRSGHIISYSVLNRKAYYTLGEIKRILQNRTIGNHNK